MFNSMRAVRHHFVVLLFARKRNALMDRNSTSHLSAFVTRAKRKRASSSYHCNLN